MWNWRALAWFDRSPDQPVGSMPRRFPRAPTLHADRADPLWRTRPVRVLWTSGGHDRNVGEVGQNVGVTPDAAPDALLPG